MVAGEHTNITMKNSSMYLTNEVLKNPQRKSNRLLNTRFRYTECFWILAHQKTHNHWLRFKMGQTSFEIMKKLGKINGIQFPPEVILYALYEAILSEKKYL